MHQSAATPRGSTGASETLVVSVRIELTWSTMSQWCITNLPTDYINYFALLSKIRTYLSQNRIELSSTARVCGSTMTPAERNNLQHYILKNIKKASEFPARLFWFISVYLDFQCYLSSVSQCLSIRTFIHVLIIDDIIGETGCEHLCFL